MPYILIFNRFPLQKKTRQTYNNIYKKINYKIYKCIYTLLADNHFIRIKKCLDIKIPM